MVNLMRVLEHLRPDLTNEAKRRRGTGQSLDEISRWLCEATSLSISRESVRVWFKAQGEAVRPRSPNKAKTASVWPVTERIEAGSALARPDGSVFVVTSLEPTETGLPQVTVEPVPEPDDDPAYDDVIRISPERVTTPDPAYQQLWNAARRATVNDD